MVNKISKILIILILLFATNAVAADRYTFSKYRAANGQLHTVRYRDYDFNTCNGSLSLRTEYPNAPTNEKGIYYTIDVKKIADGSIISSTTIPSEYSPNVYSTSSNCGCVSPQVENASTGQCECPDNGELVNGQCLPKCQEGEVRNPTTDQCEVCPTETFLGIPAVCVPPCPWLEGRKPGDILMNNGACVAPPCNENEATNPDGTCRPNCTAPAVFNAQTGQCSVPDPGCGPCDTVDAMNNCVPPPPCQEDWFVRDQSTCQCNEIPCADGYERTTPGGPCVPKCSPGYERLTPESSCIPKCQYPLARDESGQCVNPDTGCGANMHKDSAGNCVPDVPDQDHDGNPDNTDPDDDGDGVPDLEDPDHWRNKPDADPDEDGQPNNADPDDDGDGTPDVDDPDGDPDNDGSPNYKDPDKDGDGVPNGADTDANGNGTPDNQEPEKPILCPQGYTKVGEQCEKNDVLPTYEDKPLGEEGSYSDRFSETIGRLKQHDIFKMKNRIGSIPGGSSSMSIDMGNLGGEMAFDFADFADVWAAIRAAFLIVCSWIGVRIVTKGGG